MSRSTLQNWRVLFGCADKEGGYNHSEIEKALHTIFENVYIRGEWYKLTEQDIERIKIITIDDIINIAQKMRKIKENLPQKPDGQMAFNFSDDENS